MTRSLTMFIRDFHCQILVVFVVLFSPYPQPVMAVIEGVELVMELPVQPFGEAVQVNGITVFYGCVNASSELDEFSGLPIFVECGLWRSDGTEPGTYQLIEGYLSNLIDFQAVLGGVLYFRHGDDINGIELWSTDGTLAGTKLFKDINPGPGDSNPIRLTALGGNLWFCANDGVHGVEPWISDGTPGPGTHLVADIRAGTESGCGLSFALTGSGRVVFGTQYQDEAGVTTEVWASDGTQAGTQKLSTEGVIFRWPWEVAVADGFAYFTENSPFINTNQVALWKTDGTAGNTLRVVELCNHPGSICMDVSSPTTLGSQIYFNYDAPGAGRELWVSDGSDIGTSLFLDLYPGNCSSTLPCGSAPRGLATFDGLLYFRANSPAGKLWVTDGTVPGTQPLGDLVTLELFQDPDGTIYFASTLAFSGAGFELYKTDGTPGGTMLVADIALGTKGSDPRYFGVFGGDLYVSANTCPTGSALWRVDPAASTPDLPLDGDCDQAEDSVDNCPATWNPSQQDTDSDGAGDACDDDDDDDGVLDPADLCPGTPVGLAVDADGCSAAQLDDLDSDGVSNNIDLCPGTKFGEAVDADGCADSQKDADFDGVSDAEDICPATPLTETPDTRGCSPSQRDSDGDGVSDAEDICGSTPPATVVGPTGCPVVVSDPGLIVFTTNGEMHTFNPANSLIASLGTVVIHPAWSADDTKLAYIRGAHLYTANADGSGEVGPWSTGLNASFTPSWSPDGSSIAFQTHEGPANDFEIYIVDLGTGDLTNVTDNLTQDRYPDWSPDGTEIVFVRDHTTMIRRNVGTGVETVVPAASPRYPEFSPDGTQVVYTRSLVTISYVTLLSGVSTDVFVGPGGTQSLNPSWSPDGSEIVFSHRPNPSTEDEDLWIVGADGENPHPVVELIDDDLYPDWGGGGGGTDPVDLGVVLAVSASSPHALDGQVLIGEITDFDVTVTNNGTETSSNAHLDLTVWSHGTITTVTGHGPGFCDDGPVMGASSDLRCPLENIPAGGHRDIVVTVEPLSHGDLVLGVDAFHADDTGGQPNVTEHPLVVTPPTDADLQLAVAVVEGDEDGDRVLTEGQLFKLRITVSNLGPAIATAVKVTSKLHSRIRAWDLPDMCSLVVDDMTCALPPDLDPFGFDTVYFNIVLQVFEAGAFSVPLFALSNQVDPTPGNASKSLPFVGITATGDRDGDGIPNAIDGAWIGGVEFDDDSAVFSSILTDIHLLGTTQAILAYRNGLDLTATDRFFGGVDINASGNSSAISESFLVCGHKTWQLLLATNEAVRISCQHSGTIEPLAAGSSVEGTQGPPPAPGSAATGIIEALAGTVEVITPSGITAFVPAGTIAYLRSNADGTLYVGVSNRSTGGGVLLLAGEVEVVVVPGDDVVFEGGFEEL